MAWRSCEATATIPGVYMPTPHGVSLDLAMLPELIDGLRAVLTEARKRGPSPNVETQQRKRGALPSPNVETQTDLEEWLKEQARKEGKP